MSDSGMRLFTGIDLPEPLAGRLDRLIHDLRPHAPVRWSKVRNLHITTKFIGEWPEARLEELKGALAALPARAPLTIGLRGLGWFPNPHRPRIFWVAVQGGDPLRALASETETALEALGVAREDREYRPHLTLARIEANVEVAPLRRAVAALPPQDFGEFVAGCQHLYLSETGNGGSRYTKLATVDFERG